MQKAIRPSESSWTKTTPGSIFRPKNEDKTSSSLSWLTSSPSPQKTPFSSTKKSSYNVLVMENAVVVFARRGCCMGHVVKKLLLTHGVNPLVVEIDAEDNNDDNIIISELGKTVINKENLPVMFIGGKLFGGLENLMAAHINGDLVPTLRQAGALWL
ncbi:Monothiol glutaredoxin-S13 [Raphanus sativus]|uniref:Monothiol glutaredoxin-S13-like n=1 Tax=Raphanus sativus TaxID=3726 RepID=A0A9W3DPZ0_RAPSA|nr:monothiol glutaredoxin-S13-like [Raphanus sativus]KAJ4914864.1 Monothiol glutaredoxin-S13 [Raphanus sativus]